jgi:hypothetical protein
VQRDELEERLERLERENAELRGALEMLAAMAGTAVRNLVRPQRDTQPAASPSESR